MKKIYRFCIGFSLFVFTLTTITVSIVLFDKSYRPNVVESQRKIKEYEFLIKEVEGQITFYTYNNLIKTKEKASSVAFLVYEYHNNECLVLIENDKSYFQIKVLDMMTCSIVESFK